MSIFTPKESATILNLFRSCNNFKLADSISKVHAFRIQSTVVGHVRNDFVPVLLNLKPNIFKVIEENDQKFVEFNKTIDTYEERTEKLATALLDLKNNGFEPLKGWRNEYLSVGENFGSPPLLKVERGATGLFGIKTFGCHVNGFICDESGKPVKMWIAKRSQNKPTYPGMYDNMVAGGLPYGITAFENVIKECQEEAGIDEKKAGECLPVGTLSYYLEKKKGLCPETQIVYDLRLDESFVPTPCDDEVESFQLCTIPEVVKLLSGGNFKPNSAMTIVHWMIRHGLIDCDNEPNYYPFLKEMCNFR